MSSTKTRRESSNRRSSSGRRNTDMDCRCEDSPTVSSKASANKDSDQKRNRTGSFTCNSPRVQTVKFNCSPDDQDDDLLPDTQPVSPNNILKGVIAYIEVRSNSENRFDGISKQMEMLGAKISKKFSSDVTHVVFKDGKKSTREKAIKKGLHLVSVLWIDSCKTNGKWVPEKLFPVGNQDDSPLLIGRMKRTKSMQPKSFEEELKDSAEKVQRRNRRREKIKSRTPQGMSSLRETHDTRSCSPFAVRPSLTPQFVPRTPGDLLRGSFNQDETFSDQKTKQVLDDESPGESHIERLAKKLRFDCNSDSPGMLVDSVLSTSCSDERNTIEKPPLIQNEKKKQMRKLLSMKQNASPNKDLPDPFQPQIPTTAKTSAKGTKVRFHAETGRFRKENQKGSSDEEDARTKSSKTCPRGEEKCVSQRTSLDDFDLKRLVKQSSPSKKTKLEKESGDDGKQSRKRKRKTRSLVMTSMHSSDQEIVFSVVDKLGVFFIDDNVCSVTSHVIAGNGRRTLNILKAIARGCWILSLEWIMKSLEAGHWIEEEPYELSEEFPSAQLCRLERCTIGDSYHCKLLADVPAIYVGESTSPPSDEIVNLIQVSGGKISKSFRNASICIGQVPKKIEATRVSEKWLLDCITSQTVVPFENYQKELSPTVKGDRSPTF